MDKIRKNNKKGLNTKLLVIGLIVYVASSLTSFILFSNMKGSIGQEADVPQPVKSASGKLLFDPNLPKTEQCPTNGAMYSKQQRGWWEKHRPLGVMIENHIDSRPQSGLSFADAVYEAVAEGGITRFLAVYYCQDSEFVGPVRSARTYFIDFLSEYGENPLYAHVGGANIAGPTNALGQIEDYGWGNYNDLNQFSIGFPVYVRDYDRLGRTVATEHTVYSSTTKLWDYAKSKRGLSQVDEEGNSWDENYVAYTFKDDAAASSRPASQSISYNFWKGYGDFAVGWTYAPETNAYTRSVGGEPHIDLVTKKPIESKNVVVLFMTETNTNNAESHMLYGTKGTGKAIVFRDGERVDATWSKSTRTAHLALKDARGRDVELNGGQIWFSVLAPNTEVTVK